LATITDRTKSLLKGGFVAFVLDHFGGIEDVAPRSMFGGVGLYAGAIFFGIVYRDILYLKVDDAARLQACRDEAVQAIRRPADDDAVVRGAARRAREQRGTDDMGAAGN
jgi:hypothetical protein